MLWDILGAIGCKFCLHVWCHKVISSLWLNLHNLPRNSYVIYCFITWMKIVSYYILWDTFSGYFQGSVTKEEKNLDTRVGGRGPAVRVNQGGQPQQRRQPKRYALHNMFCDTYCCHHFGSQPTGTANWHRWLAQPSGCVGGKLTHWG